MRKSLSPVMACYVTRATWDEQGAYIMEWKDYVQKAIDQGVRKDGSRR